MKKEDLLVSVVIPAYNTSNYIEKMLQNVFHQTYCNYEVIVIDDESTDGTPDIVRNCISKWNWGGQCRLIQQKHGGVSKARNLGIEQAKGEKIFFWDSDDAMEPAVIADCMDFSNKHEVNSVLYGYSNRYNDIIETPREHNLEDEYRGREIVERLMPHFLGHSYGDINNWIRGKCGIRYGKEHTALWRIMLDTAVIKNNGLKFDEKLSLGEDTRFINEYMLYETSIGFLNKCLYYLTIRKNGANLSSLNDPKKRLNDKLKLIDARNQIDLKAKMLYDIDTHPFWSGTMILSVVEMAMKLSKDKNRDLNYNYSLFKIFISNRIVRNAVNNFNPVLGLKSIPFFIMKYCGCNILFWIFYLLPNKLMQAFIKSNA